MWTVVPPSVPWSIESRPLSVRARSAIASKLRRRRSPGASSETDVSKPPSAVRSTWIEIRFGGPRRTAWLRASRMIWYTPAWAFSDRASAASTSTSIRTLFVRATLSASARSAGLKPWSRRTTGSRLNERSRSERIVSRWRARGDALRFLEPALVDRVPDGVQHQRDPGQRLDGAVVELVRKPPPLVLLGRDELLGEPRLLGEEAGVLARA